LKLRRRPDLRPLRRLSLSRLLRLGLRRHLRAQAEACGNKQGNRQQ
jgi:hypothetical protein